MPSVEALLLLVTAAAAAAAYVIAARRHPQVGVVALVGVIAFVPIWVGASVGVFVSAASVVAVLTAAALWPHRPPRLGLADLLMGFVAVAALAPLSLGALSLSSAFGVVTVWMAGYLAGRFAMLRLEPGAIYAVVTVVFGVVGLLAVVEFLSGWHGLASWGPWNSSRMAWGSIQIRGGLARAEGAFGHSIALGASCAMAAALAYGARLPAAVRTLAMVAIVAGAAVSLSRLGVLTAALGLGLCVVTLAAPAFRQVRRTTAWLLVLGGALLVPWVLTVLERAGDEAAVSASYRSDLLSLIPEIGLLGSSDSMSRSAAGTLYFDGFRSIDSQLLLFGLSYGWLVLLGVLGLVGVMTARLVVRRGDPAAVAIAAQLPALATVALITQYAVFFWFVLGLAVSAQTRGVATRGSAGRPGDGLPAAAGQGAMVRHDAR